MGDMERWKSLFSINNIVWETIFILLTSLPVRKRYVIRSSEGTPAKEVGNKERRESLIIKKRIKSPVPMKERWFMRFLYELFQSMLKNEHPHFKMIIIFH